jgi:selenocysteine lyase/cysteine desulfurase
LTRIPGAKIHSPCNPRDGTGINTVSIESMDGVAFSAALRDRFKIITRPALRGTTVRISLAVYIEEADVDYLLQSIATLAAG